MNEKIYNKLVRDKIPEIIETDNRKCEVELVDKNELIELLNIKLLEEVNEYLESSDIEELADILEVIYSIIKQRDISIDEVESIRIKKNNERGGFDKGIKLIKVYKKEETSY